MARQGGCTLEPDESGHVLDRLAGLEQVIAPELIGQALAASGKVQRKSCPLSFDILLWVVLAMGLFTDVPIRQVFRQCRCLHRQQKTPGRAALCRGRKRLGTAPLRRLFLLLVCLLGGPDVPGCFYEGYRLMGVDGGLCNVPDTPANERAFGRPRGGHTSASRGAFPQVSKVSLVELGDHDPQPKPRMGAVVVDRYTIVCRLIPGIGQSTAGRDRTVTTGVSIVTISRKTPERTVFNECVFSS